MGLWTWDVAYELGIKEIDEQHIKLASHVNLLYDATRDNADLKTMEGLFSSSNKDLFDHLDYEEDLFIKAKYNEIETLAHKRAHDKFRTLLNRYMAQLQVGENITRQYIAELQIWITHHILVEDKKYIETVRQYFYEEQIRRAEALNI